MNDVAIERLARRLADEIAAGRRTSFTTTDGAVRDLVVSRVRHILAGEPTLEETPD